MSYYMDSCGQEINDVSWSARELTMPARGLYEPANYINLTLYSISKSPGKWTG